MRSRSDGHDAATAACWYRGHRTGRAERDVCLVHAPRGIDSLEHWREPEHGEPSILQRALV